MSGNPYFLDTEGSVLTLANDEREWILRVLWTMDLVFLEALTQGTVQQVSRASNFLPQLSL